MAGVRKIAVKQSEMNELEYFEQFLVSKVLWTILTVDMNWLYNF